MGKNRARLERVARWYASTPTWISCCTKLWSGTKGQMCHLQREPLLKGCAWLTLSEALSKFPECFQQCPAKALSNRRTGLWTRTSGTYCESSVPKLATFRLAKEGNLLIPHIPMFPLAVACAVNVSWFTKWAFSTVWWSCNAIKDVVRCVYVYL